MKSEANELFAKAPVPIAVLKNVIPSIISMIMVLLYNLADTYFIGQTKDPLMMSAVSITTPVFFLFMAVGMLFGIGGTSFISRLLGQGNPDKAKHVSSFCFWTSVVVGIIATILIFLFRTQLCYAIGASKDTVKLASNYVWIVGLGIPFLIVSNAFSNIIRAEGRVKTAMVGIVVGNLTNIILDPIFILGFGWGVAGAAIATTIGNVCAALCYIIHLSSKRTALSISPRKYRWINGVATGVFAIGIPASLNSVLLSVSNILINVKMAHFGDLAVAGLGVAMKINMIVVMLLIGLGTGVQPLLGYCFGAKNLKRFKSVLMFTCFVAITMSAIMTVICYFFAKPLTAIFLEDATASAYGISFCRLLIISGPILGILFVLINAIQSTGSAVGALILSISRQGIFFIPVLLLIVAVHYTERALVIAQPIADYMSTLLAIIITMKIYRKAVRTMSTPDEVALAQDKED